MLRLTSTYADGPMGLGKEPTVGDIVRRQEWIAETDSSLMLPVMLRAEHGKTSTTVCEEDAGSLLVGDGLITWERQLPLVMTHSDCLPIFLWDAEETMCGVVHAGWRGIVAGILPEVVRNIVNKGIAADRLRIEIGPHIGKCCFEIKEDVALPLREVCPSAVLERENKLYGSLADAAISQAVSAGVQAVNIVTDPRCTYCTAVNGVPVFASYRREGVLEKKHDQRYCPYMIRPTFKIEKELFAEGFVVAGCDEVGRGCLAGPVVAAVVQLPEKLPKGWKTLLRDSKMLSRLQRIEADKWIRTHAIQFGIGLVDAATIDRINILQASYEAMRIALKDFDAKTYILVDGHLRIPGIVQRQTAIVGGDAISASIAAASIIAKEYRDRLMEDLHKEFPLYRFDQNKGYGTSSHMKAIAAHGLLSEHRITFCKKIPGAGAGTREV